MEKVMGLFVGLNKLNLIIIFESLKKLEKWSYENIYLHNEM